MASAKPEQGDDTVAQSPKKKGKGKLGLLIVVLALLLLGGAGAWWFMHPTPKKAGAAKAANLPEIYMPLDPAFVVNFQDQDAARFLQVGVTLMAHDQSALDAVRQNDPVVRNALVMLFSSQSYAVLSSAQGKLKLQAQALAAVRKIVAAHTGKPGVDALYFTSFVMQ